jgi:chromosome segregation ATPase
MKPGFCLNETRDPTRRLKRLQEQRDTLQAHIAQLQDKIEIIEHEIGECVL